MLCIVDDQVFCVNVFFGAYIRQAISNGQAVSDGGKYWLHVNVVADEYFCDVT